MGAFQNIGINAYLKRYGLKNGLLRGIYMANPIHIVRDYENKKLLYYYHAKKYIKIIMKNMQMKLMTMLNMGNV